MLSIISILCLLLILSYFYAQSMLRYHEYFCFKNKLGLFIFGARKKRPLGIPILLSPSEYEVEKFEIKLVNNKFLSGLVLINKKPSNKYMFILAGFNRVYGNMEAEVDAFISLGLNVVLFDYSGVGYSGVDRIGLGYKESFELCKVVEFVEQKYSVESKLAFGFSMGAITILWAQKKYGVKFDKIILESLYSSLKSTIENRLKNFGIPPFPVTQLILFWSFIIDRIPYWNFMLKYLLENSGNLKYLIFHGALDKKSQLDQVQKALRIISNNSFKLISFDFAQHEALISKDSKLWFENIEIFLNID